LAETMTVAGFDVHARSIDGAAVHVPTGELVRIRFGGSVDGPIEWLRSLSGPVRACYDAGPTGFGLYRAAVAAGIDMRVVAPGKTPRGRADRVKTDRKDAELLARLLLAGSLTAIAVPSPEVEAARDLVRAHDAVRRDLMRARHRVSSSCCVTAVSIRSPRRGRSRTARGCRASSSSTPAVSLRSPIRSPPSTAWRLARPPWPSACRGWRSMSSGGRPSPGCAAFAGSTADRAGVAPRARRRLAALRACVLHRLDADRPGVGQRGRRNDGCTCGAYAAAAARDALPERAFGVHDGGAVGVEAPSSRGARPAGLKRVRLCAGGRSRGG
jgi:hypothetical protein